MQVPLIEIQQSTVCCLRGKSQDACATRTSKVKRTYTCRWRRDFKGPSLLCQTGQLNVCLPQIAGRTFKLCMAEGNVIHLTTWWFASRQRAPKGSRGWAVSWTEVRGDIWSCWQQLQEHRAGSGQREPETPHCKGSLRHLRAKGAWDTSFLMQSDSSRAGQKSLFSLQTVQIWMKKFFLEEQHILLGRCG